MGVNGYQTVGDELSKEYIVGGSDMTPAEIRRRPARPGFRQSIELPTCDVVDEQIDTGAEARCFAQYMRVHALEASGRSELRADGALSVGSEPDDPAGTSDEAAAAKDESGQPISNGARNTWITETALATGAERLVHGRADLGLRHRRRGRVDPDRHRSRHPCVRGVRSRAGGDGTAGRSLIRRREPPGREAPTSR